MSTNRTYVGPLGALGIAPSNGRGCLTIRWVRAVIGTGGITSSLASMYGLGLGFSCGPR